MIAYMGEVCQKMNKKSPPRNAEDPELM